MATKLDKSIKRELELDGRVYTIIISPNGVKVTPKGGRIGREVAWRTILGESPAPASSGGDGSNG